LHADLVLSPPDHFGIDKSALLIIEEPDVTGQSDSAHEAELRALRGTIMHLAFDQKLAVLVENLAAAQPRPFSGRIAPVLALGLRWDLHDTIRDKAFALARCGMIDFAGFQERLGFFRVGKLRF
jgi:hypothetical protein